MGWLESMIRVSFLELAELAVPTGRFESDKNLRSEVAAWFSILRFSARVDAFDGRH